MMKKKRVNMWLVLPEEIISLIFTSLDLKDVAKCMLVCKQWRKLISDLVSDNPLLGAKSGHLQFLGYDFVGHRFGALDEETGQVVWMKTLHRSWRINQPPNHEVTLSSSCNGLVCLVSPHHYRHLYICNPILGQHISLDKPWVDVREYILGFCPTSNEYKLAALRPTSLEILTLGNPNPNPWRTLPYERPAPEFGYRAICVKGVFHRLLTPQSISTLDLAKEVLGSTPIPRLEADKEMYQLACIDTCLAATAGYRKGYVPRGRSPCYIEIWVRKEDKLPPDELVWTKNWIIDDVLWLSVNYRFFVPRKLSTDGCIIMTHRDHRFPFMLPYRLYSYDPRNNRMRRPRHYGVRAFDYTPTLVSPKNIQCKNKRTTRVQG